MIKEAVRLSFGSPGKLTRVVPEGGATFDGHFIPAGVNTSLNLNCNELTKRSHLSQ